MKIIDIPKQTLDLLAFRIDGAEPWPEAEALSTSLEPVSVFDQELLPEVLQNFVMDSSHRMQAPPDFVAVASIVALGSVIGTGCAVRPKQQDDWSEHPNLWGGIIGGPSTMKSPSMSAGFEPIVWLEAEARTDYDAAQSRYLADKAIREHELKILRSDKGFAKLHLTEEEGLARLRELMSTALDEPKLKRFRTNDATVEMIGEILKDNPRGLLLVRDELVGLLANCNRQGHEGDRPFYLEAWNGQQSFSVDRIGRGSIVIPRLCLSVFGGIQPAKLEAYIAGTVDGYDNDGLLQRFQLMVYPDPIENWQYVDQAANAEVRDKIVDIARVLAKADFVALGATKNGEKPPFFRFSPSAQKIFVSWLIDHEHMIRKQENPVLAEHLSKFRKLVPALALIFHLMDLANGRKFRHSGISKESLSRALRWVPYLTSHALRIYSLALDPVQTAAQALGRKIAAGTLMDGFSVRDVYKAGWANLTDQDIASAACAELEAAGWIRRIPVERSNGRPPSPSYQINPTVRSSK